MKLLVCGGRDFNDYTMLSDALGKINDKRTISIMITGGCDGADTLAADWAANRGINVAVVDALWNRHGKKAGPIRNSAMLLLEPDGCVAFSGGKGTENMINKCWAAQVPVWDLRDK